MDITSTIEEKYLQEKRSSEQIEKLNIAEIEGNIVETIEMAPKMREVIRILKETTNSRIIDL
jgi:hypothetical protein